MAVIDDFKVRFPEIDESLIDTYLPGLIIVYPSYYGGDYDIALDKEIILNLLAHMLTVSTSGSTAAAGMVASQSVGSVSQSFFTGNIKYGDDYFMSTRYGQAYLQLTMQNLGGIFV